eukprot:Em0012g716a
MHRSTQKAVMSTPNLEKALQLMQDVPKRANDAMTLSMICGYDGNIHTHGQIILEDEFVVSERGRWVGNKRQLFLLNQRIIITKEKDADGLYLFKDQLKIQNLTLTEKEGDNPCRFGVGTGAINNWEQYYLLEASSPEKKQQWVLAIKDILKQQFELLRALSKPNTKEGFGSPSTANMAFSDDSDDDSGGCSSPEPVCGRQARSMSTPFDDLYMVEEDCAPAKEDEGILYLYKGQVYKILNRSSHQWWYGRLVRDVVPSRGVPGQAGWIAESFVGKFVGELTQEEVAIVRALNTPASPKKTLKYVASPIRPFNHTFNAGGGGKSKKSDLHTYSTVGSKKNDRLTKLHITNSQNYHEELNERLSSNSPQREKVWGADTGVDTVCYMCQSSCRHLSNETVIAGRTVHFKCEVTKGVPPPSVVWTKDGLPLNIDRAFCSEGGETVHPQDHRESHPLLATSLRHLLNVLAYEPIVNIKKMHSDVIIATVDFEPHCAPGPTSRPGVRLLTSTSVSLSWTPPTWDGHSPITMYMMECKEGGDNWSTLMRRVTEPSAVVDDLVPGAEYMFRVVAGNAIGFGEPGPPSDKVRMAKPSSTMEGMFSSDPFEEQYTLLDEIARGQFSVVRECQHNTTQQIYAAKLLPIQIGHSHAQHELQMLSKLAHPNIIQIAAAYMSSDHYILIFQKIQGVNLFDFFIHHNCLSHQTASGSCAQIFDVLSYLHSFKIAHLDIRPENILTIKQPDSLIPTLKVIHFERANHIDQDSSLIVQIMDDYLDYQAPELINGEAATLSTDMWSMGVLIFTLSVVDHPSLWTHWTSPETTSRAHAIHSHPSTSTTKSKTSSPTSRERQQVSGSTVRSTTCAGAQWRSFAIACYKHASVNRKGAAKPSLKKQIVSAELKDILQHSQLAVLYHYNDLTVQEWDSLRLKLGAKGVKLKIFPSKVSAKVLKGTKYENMGSLFTGPSVLAFSESPVLSDLLTVTKGEKKLMVLGGLLENQLFTPKGLDSYTKLLLWRRHVRSWWAFSPTLRPHLAPCFRAVLQDCPICSTR